jgi:phage gp45-like
MWISGKIGGTRGAEGAVVAGQVTGGQNARIAAQGETEYRGLPLAAPWGIAYLPPFGASAVIVGGAEHPVCVGTVVEEQNLQPGELLLFSAGGARICLKNSGEVIINGQTFAARGED